MPPQTQPVYVTLPFTVEPLPTHYARRADAYAFVRPVLDETFGAATVATLHRLTADGPVAQDLASELTFMERLSRGAAEVSRSEIGLPPSGTGPEVEANREVFRTLGGHVPHRPRPRDRRADDGARLLRPRAPEDEGVGLPRLDAAVRCRRASRSQPKIVATKKTAPFPEWNGDVYFNVPSGVVFSPVVAEVYVTEILDRQEMRKRCDEGKTRSAILASLR